MARCAFNIRKLWLKKWSWSTRIHLFTSNFLFWSENNFCKLYESPSLYYYQCIIFVHFLSISENEFFYEIKRDGITSLHGIHIFHNYLGRSSLVASTWLSRGCSLAVNRMHPKVIHLWPVALSPSSFLAHPNLVFSVDSRLEHRVNQRQRVKSERRRRRGGEPLPRNHLTRKTRYVLSFQCASSRLVASKALLIPLNVSRLS